MTLTMEDTITHLDEGLDDTPRCGVQDQHRGVTPPVATHVGMLPCAHNGLLCPACAQKYAERLSMYSPDEEADCAKCEAVFLISEVRIIPLP